METLNHYYLTVPEPVATGQSYRVFLRAHLRHGRYAAPELLRRDITTQVPPLESMSYRDHVLPLLTAYQHYLEQAEALPVRAVDVEVQYHASNPIMK